MDNSGHRKGMQIPNLNRIDLAIVDCRMENRGLSRAEIAHLRGSLYGGILRHRLGRLCKQDSIDLSATPNPKALGFSVMTNVLIQVDPSLP
ncbi:MAG: hypothetical protein AMJ88_06745 [Anaerolineae bacterium SM23_ 63]|nr:MAG: hypothetical protein AMJ88_06745 [Anaerolineae bacterium SM23_ 63]